MFSSILPFVEEQLQDLSLKVNGKLGGQNAIVDPSFAQNFPFNVALNNVCGR